MQDPIVEEVRKHRQENAAKFGYDVRAIAEDARKHEKAGSHRIAKPRKSGKKAKTLAQRAAAKSKR